MGIRSKLKAYSHSPLGAMPPSTPVPTCALMRATRKLFLLSNIDFSRRHS